MREILRDFQNKEEKKLLLIDSATGYGKSTIISQHIAEVAFHNTDQKFIYMTQRKSNLERPLELLKEYCSNNPDITIEDFKKYVLYMESIEDNFRHIFDYNLNIPIKEEPNLKKILNDVKSAYKKYIECSHDIEIRNIFRDKFLDAEKIFRYTLKNYFYDKFNIYLKNKYTETELKNLDKNNIFNEKIYFKNEYTTWIAEFYPSINFYEKKIVILTIDKFLSPSNIIIDTLDFSSISNYTIVIDEFEDIKLLKRKKDIEAMLTNKIKIHNIIECVNDNSNVLNTVDNLLEKCGSNNKHALESVFKHANDIVSECNLKAGFVYDSNEIGNKKEKISIFRDNTVKTVVTNDIYLTYKFDSDIGHNKILISKYNSKEQSFFNLLDNEHTFLRHLCTVVYNMSYQYYDRNQISSMDLAISTILNDLRINKDTDNPLLNPSFFNIYGNGNDFFKKPATLLDYEFYLRGFRLCSIINKEEHNERTECVSYVFNTSTEKLLLDLAENNKIIGLSATCTEETINVPNVSFLKEKLNFKDGFYSLTDKDFERMEKSFNDKETKNEVIVYKISASKSEINERAKDDCINWIMREYVKGCDEFIRVKWCKLVKICDYFLSQDEIYSFLHFSNAAFTNKENNNFIKDITDQDIIKDIFKFLIETRYKNKNFDVNNIFFLNAENLKKDSAQLNSMKKKLAEGEKVFVFTTYKSAGAGYNFCYTVPKILKDILIYGKNNSNANTDKIIEKDFDAIYIENPTYIVPNLYDSIADKNVFEYILTVKDAAELHQISSHEEKEEIAYALSRQDYESKNIKSVIRTINCYKLECFRIIEQAIGRICRTSIKMPKTFVLFDENIYDNFTNILISNRNKRTRTHTYKTFLNYLRHSEILQQETRNIGDEMEIAALSKCEKTMQFYKRHFYNNNRKQNSISSEEWIEWREFFMKNGLNITEDIYSHNMIANNFYIECPDDCNVIYYILERGREEIARIFFKAEDIPDDLKDNILQVSYKSLRFDDVLQVPDIKKYFKSKGYMLYDNYVPTKYIMSPITFNNYYKGIMGEKIGYYILDVLTNISLLQMPETVHEFFDFYIESKNKHRIYLDFKYFYDNSGLEIDLNEVKNKLNKCGGGYALIINIFSEHESPYNRGDNIYMIPSLFCTKTKKINLKAIKLIVELIDNE